MIDPVGTDASVAGEGLVDDGDLAARLFDEHADRLVGLACLLLRDRADAEDVVQEAFLRLQRHASSIEGAGREAAYLRSIVLNLARSRLRRRQLAVWKRPPAPVAGAGPDEGFRVRWVLVDGPGRSRDVETPPAGTVVVSVLGPNSEWTDIDPTTDTLTVEIATPAVAEQLGH